MKILKIPNQIISGKLTPLDLKKVDSVVLHHVAHKSADVKEVERWHIGKGWNAIGYNYFVSFDGKVYEGRGLNVGAGVLNHNYHIVSVVFQGDYEKYNTDMPKAQLIAGQKLVEYLKNILPDAKILRHKDFGGTLCPGKHFPFEKFLIKEEDEMIYNYIDENLPDWSRETVEKLVKLGYLKGNEKGELGLNDSILKVLVINDRAGLYN